MLRIVNPATEELVREVEVALVAAPSTVELQLSVDEDRILA